MTDSTEVNNLISSKRKRGLILLFCLLCLVISLFCLNAVFGDAVSVLESKIQNSSLKNIPWLKNSESIHRRKRRAGRFLAQNKGSSQSQHEFYEVESLTRIKNENFQEPLEGQVQSDPLEKQSKSLPKILLFEDSGIEGTGPLLQWKEVKDARGYELEISREKTFGTLEKKVLVQVNHYYWNIKNINVGTFYWRVRAIDKEAQLGSESIVGLLLIKEVPVVQRTADGLPLIITAQSSLTPSQPLVTTTPENTTLSLSPFLNWPRFQLQIGALVGLSAYQSTLGPNILNNGQLSENQGGTVMVQYSISPRFFTKLYYEEADGKVVDSSGFTVDKNFKSAWSGIAMGYRFLADQENGIGYYAGVGIEHSQEYRYTYATNALASVINIPFTLDEAKFILGLDYRSYYLWRGSLALNVFQTFNAVPGGSSANGGFNNLTTTFSDGTHFSVDASIAHIIFGNYYLGVGGEYQFHRYQFTSNELGTIQSGNVSLSHSLSKIFLGTEW